MKRAANSAIKAQAAPTAKRKSSIFSPRGTAVTLLVASGSLVVTLALLDQLLPPFDIATALASLAVWSVVAMLIWHYRGLHPFSHFGAANVVTTARAVSTAVLAGLIPIAAQIDSTAWAWAIALSATITLCLDGLDGYLARKTRTCSAYGARFDMETDALLALVITVFLWQSEHVGIWVLALGLMRYAFLAAAIWLTFLREELYPSMRRKTVCVIQVGSLCLMLCPWLSSLQASVVGALALVCLSYSFATDVLWLFRTHRARLNSQQQ